MTTTDVHAHDAMQFVNDQDAATIERFIDRLEFRGSDPTFVGYRDAWRLAERLPRATYAVLDGAGHHAHLEREAETAALLRGWLADVAAAAR